jgi:hypothetical protein
MTTSRNADVSPANAGNLNNHAAHIAHPDGAVSPTTSGDHADGCGSNWESAWIDLGGEG